MQKRVAALRKEVGDALKTVRTLLTARVIDTLVEDLSCVQLNDAGILVKRIDDQEARSALLPTLQKLTKVAEPARAYVLYAVDQAAGRIFYHSASTCPSKFDALACLRNFTANIEGAKCGGSAVMAQGSAPLPDQDGWEESALSSIA